MKFPVLVLSKEVIVVEATLVADIGQARRVTEQSVVEYPTLDELWKAFRAKKGLDITIVRSISLTSDGPAESTVDANNAKLVTWRLPITAEVVTHKVHLSYVSSITVISTDEYSFTGLVTRYGKHDSEYFDVYTVSYSNLGDARQQTPTVTYDFAKGKKPDGRSLLRPLRYRE